ncbi:transposase [candidate division MSBL1 archaeon SCGC-AAA261C02]|uniref:Transposase n=1 Tax=candidate division MSBL1 archaeon SCGC-AAA261C02 TaxID=1698272 RepID=A0A133V1C0_9EURY|nr:transposase [candidate division MSBL1 archaeon SCGC-AAA261C02]
MKYTYKFRLYPTQEQEVKLGETLELCRRTYNRFLSQINETDEIPKRTNLQFQLPEMKKRDSDLKQVYSKVLQMVLYQLYSNLRSLSKLKKNGRKIGRLRYKDKGWFKTFTYNQSGFKIIKTNNRLDKLHLSKIGDIPIRVHREIEGKIKQITIKRTNSGKWFACICVEKRPQQEKSIKSAIGIDVGITYFATDSDGRQIENPHNLEKSLGRLRKEQQKLSRKRKGSENYEKQRKKVAKLHEKIKNQRDDFLHKLSRHYVDNYDLIAVEDLNVKEMIGNNHLSRYISDASWSKFVRYLSYKAESAGKMVVKVDPKGTSQEHKHGELDRDYNASLNILERGMKEIGMGRAESTLVETEPLLHLSSQDVITGQVQSSKQEAHAKA